MKASDMPPPDAVIEYENGRVGRAMFHYGMPEGVSASDIAAENGFDSKFDTLESDDREEAQVLYERYGNDGGWEIINEWQPLVPEGWELAEKYDTEDGPVAMFIRPAGKGGAK